MPAWTQKLLFVFVIAFLLIQLVRPARTNPPTDATRTIHASLTVTSTAAPLLVRACNDCHSHQTMWPWYSSVAPVSWLVVNDVKRGRRAMNFSDWKSLTPKKQQEVLGDICSEVTEGKMPKPEYVLLHPSAKLTSAEVQEMCTWVNSLRQAELEQSESE